MAVRSHHILAIIAILAAGIAIKWLFLANRADQPRPESGHSATIDVFQMQKEKNDLPVLEIKDPF